MHLDFETFSELDIKKVGGYRYAAHSSTEVLMAAYAFHDEVPKLWVPAEGEEMPEDLRQAFADDDVIIEAFNANFERMIIREVLGMDLPVERFLCVMQHAWYLGFSGSLGQVGAQLGLSPDKAKMSTGSKLIHKFCKPAPSSHKVDRYTHENAPEDWAEFKRYCINDVVAEREIDMLITPYEWPESERRLWYMDQRINDRGVPADRELIDAACKVERYAKAAIIDNMNLFTGLANANSATQLANWLHAEGYQLPNMKKDTLEKFVKTMPESLAKVVINMRLAANKTSTTKWHAYQRALMDDDRLRGMFQFGGAQRTQRWAGRIVQLHNLKRPSTKDGSVLMGWVQEILDAA